MSPTSNHSVESTRDEVPEASSPPLIGFYVYPNHAMADLAGPLTTFNMPRIFGMKTHYATAVLSRAGGSVPSFEGPTVSSVSTPEAEIDTLIVIGGPGVFSASRAELAEIQHYAKSARRVASVCTGAFLLASAGILDGRRATTHWAHAEHLATSFPLVEVESDRIYVQDGPVWSSAGVTAGIDLALALIEADYGLDLTRKIAQHLVVPVRRRGGQSQYSEMLAMDPLTDRIARTLSFAQAHLHENLTVERLATIACLSPRHFGRSFQAETGETPAQAIERLRTETAKGRVAGSIEPIEQIAASVGFSDPERMRRAFIRRFGKSPQALRRVARALATHV